MFLSKPCFSLTVLSGPSGKKQTLSVSLEIQLQILAEVAVERLIRICCASLVARKKQHLSVSCVKIK